MLSLHFHGLNYLSKQLTDFDNDVDFSSSIILVSSS